MKNITLIILILFLYSCGYSSIYKNQKSQNFKINIVEATGNSEMNNLIKNEIKLYSGENTTNIYNLKINTDYIKETLTKDSAGVITDYKLTNVSIFTVDLKGMPKVIELKETINIKNQSDSFEQNIYEKNIKRSFASSIREKLMSEIFNINDN
jgi:outer membrane lipopolysaccharide assembly protein LptE/RlpB